MSSSQEDATCTWWYSIYNPQVSWSKMSKNKSYSENAQLTCLKKILGAFRKPKLLKEYLWNYSEPRYEILDTCTWWYYIYIIQVSCSETSHNKSYSENSKLTSLKNISGAFRKPNFLILYLRNYSESRYKIWTRCTWRYYIYIL